jgi:hypothetical protein
MGEGDFVVDRQRTSMLNAACPSQSKQLRWCGVTSKSRDVVVKE